MSERVIVPLAAVVMIGIGMIVALAKGIDGAVFASAAATIGGIAGWTAKGRSNGSGAGGKRAE